MKPPVRIYVSPDVARSHGPELDWVVDALLVGVGRSWSFSTELDGPVDLAYVRGGEPAPEARVTISAEPDGWATLRAGALRRLADRVANGRLEDGDVLADCFSLASGLDESSWSRDVHGHHFAPDASAAALVRDAVVSRIAILLAERCGGLGSTAWPDDARLAAVATHDVDYPRAIRWIEPLRAVRRGRPVAVAAALATGRLHHWHFDSWLSLERALGIRSAFFFVARRGSLLEYARGTPDPFYDVDDDRFGAVFARMRDEGFEIGLQPSYRACEQRGTLELEKRKLERAARVDVAGGRHHYWRLDPDEPDETLLLHEQAGLAYDCSLSFERIAGWRRGLSWPFQPFNHRLRRAVRTVELPTAWMDDHAFGHATLNDAVGADERRSMLERLAEVAAATRGALVTDMHEYVYDADLFPGWRAAYEHLWRELAHRGDVWIALPREVAARWSEHADDLRAASRGLGCASPS